MTPALVTTRDTTAMPASPISSLRAFGWAETELPEGLTEDDYARIAATIVAGRAASTRKTYASMWPRFDHWCACRGITAMPATPATVCAYLADMATCGFAAGTIEGASAAIAAAHETQGHESPTADPTVRAVRRGIRRALGTAPRRQSRPLSTADIRQILTHIDRSDPRGVRDAAIILLGFASALRRSELASLVMADIEPQPEGLLVRIRRSKTDPEQRGQVVGVAHGAHPETDPIGALDAWLQLRGGQPGPLFLGMSSGRIGNRPFTGSGLAWMLKQRAAAAGLPSERISGHSLRAGHATTAAMAGVDLARIAAQTRHTRISTLVEHYIRPLEAIQVTSSRYLGL